MQLPACAAQIPDLVTALQQANHLDVRAVTSPVDLRSFIAGVLGYQPGWMTFLYRVRWGFVRLLGMKQEGIPRSPRLRPEEVTFTPGEKAAFFTVKDAQEDRYWIAGGDDKHLDFVLGIVVEPLADGTRRFHAITLVHYNHWTGPVYFNVIRPFHHLVVWAATRYATQPPRDIQIQAGA